MSEWIKEAAEEIALEWRAIEAECGRHEAAMQDPYAGHACTVESLSTIIEKHWDASLTDAVPVDVANWLDQAQDEIRSLKDQLAVADEQFKVACQRSESWKELCGKYKELAESRGEAIDVWRRK